MKTKVLIVERVYKRSRSEFDQADDIEFMPVAKQEPVIAEEIKKHDAPCLVLATDKYEDKLYEALCEGGLIARYGVGHDSIDKRKASEKKQFVTITPGVLDQSVAEHAIFLMGSLARKIPIKDAEIKKDTWHKTKGIELSGRTLLIVGCGAIGSKVAKIASFGFDMNVIAFDVARLDQKKMKKRYGISKIVNQPDESLQKADFVSIHLPSVKQTENFVNTDFISKMKPDAFLVNTARGTVLDENDLYYALSANKIAGAALDVFKNEPYQPQDPEKDLRNLDNIVMTPHLGSSTEEASDRMAELVIKNIRNWRDKKYQNMDIVNTEILK